jgi:hypothetical protein
MTQYVNRLTLAVPELLIPSANQLALIIGESVADANTFKDADWQDAQGNLYATCSFVSKPVILGTLESGLPEEYPEYAVEADIGLAQEALESIVVYTEGTTASVGSIILSINDNPLGVLYAMGLTEVGGI